MLKNSNLSNWLLAFQIFKCMICNEKCNSEKAFADHINRLHNGRDREYVTCDDCGAQFRQKNQLRFGIVSLLLSSVELSLLQHCSYYILLKIGCTVSQDAEPFAATNVINVKQRLWHQTHWMHICWFILGRRSICATFVAIAFWVVDNWKSMNDPIPKKNPTNAWWELLHLDGNEKNEKVEIFELL